MPLASLIILRSENGRDDWTPVSLDEIPEWLKNPYVMGKLVSGEMARKDGGLVVPEDAGPWYRAEGYADPD